MWASESVLKPRLSGHLMRFSALPVLTNIEFAPLRFSKTTPADSARRLSKRPLSRILSWSHYFWRKGCHMRFLPAEKFVVKIILALAMLDTALLQYKQVNIDIPGYIWALMTGGVAIAIGQIYRRFRHNEGIALATTAAGLFVVFTIVGSVFNYLLLPIQGERIDPLLMQIDAQLGYSWSGLVTWASHHPPIGALLQFVYLSSMPQLIIVILVLGFSKRRDDLHRFLLTGLIAALITIGFWGFFPSSGPAAWEVLPKEVLASLPTVVGPGYGAELNRLASEGVTYITPNEVLGLIAFPSFHTVMALLSVCFMARFQKVMPVFVALNILMVPAILIHGGHHLTDIFGGAMTFAVAMALSGQALRQMTHAAPPWEPAASKA
jgi:PAP2 superfamily